MSKTMSKSKVEITPEPAEQRDARYARRYGLDPHTDSSEAASGKRDQ